ncbi:hypothetical protein AB0L20_31385, partial [Streptomyces albidoflavus]
MDRETGRPGTGLRTGPRTPPAGVARTPRPRLGQRVPGAPPPPAAQIALAWVQQQAEVHRLPVVPIPGTRKPTR